MDLESLVLPKDESLSELRSSTASPSVTLPDAGGSNSSLLKFGASGILSVAGVIYLSIGKKEGSFEKMAIGAALTLGSIFLF